MDLGEYQAIGSELMQLLRLENPPVAISFVDTPPRGAKKNKESVAAGCVFWIRGFKDTFYTDQRDYANCNIGSFTHGFLAPEKVSLDDCVDVALFDKTGYFPASEFGGVPRMSEAPNFVAYGPPHENAFELRGVRRLGHARRAMLVGEAASAPRSMGGPPGAAIPVASNGGRVGVTRGRPAVPRRRWARPSTSEHSRLPPRA